MSYFIDEELSQSSKSTSIQLSTTLVFQRKLKTVFKSSPQNKRSTTLNNFLVVIKLMMISLNKFQRNKNSSLMHLQESQSQVSTVNFTSHFMRDYKGMKLLL